MPVLNLLLAFIAGSCAFFLLLPMEWQSLRVRSDPQHNVVDQLQSQRTTLLEKFMRRLQRKGAGMRIEQYFVLSTSLGIGAVWVSMAVLQSWWMALPACLAGPLLTERIVNLMGARRKERFEEGNVKAIRLMASSLRSSPSYLHAFQQAAENPYIPKRVSAEYRRVVEMLRAQIPLERVMAEFYERTGSSDVNHLAMIVRIQREMGGDMAKTLDLASSAILRKRQALRRQRAAMSQILAQVNVLSVMPFVFIGALVGNNPHHFDSLTASTAGRMTIWGCFASILAGGEVIRYLALKGLHKGG